MGAKHWANTWTEIEELGNGKFAATVPTITNGVSAIDSVAFYYPTGLTAYLGLGSANFSTV